MADAKISQLPVATTPLAGTELVPVVQGGVTVQTTVGDVLTGAVPSGTANGVLYLNGSKVVTSGSALTFDGSRLSVGAGTALSVAGYNNIVINGSTGGLLELKSNDTRVLQIQTDGAAAGAQIATVANGSNPPLIFGVNSTEQMRLTSTGLGIGTSSPGAKLNVAGAAGTSVNTILANGTTTGANFWRLTNTGGDGVLGVESSSPGGIVSSSSAYATVLYTVGATPLQLGTNSSIKATLDTSGNLGLGVTPSAWLSSFKALQVGTAAVSQIANRAYLTANWFSNGSGTDTYIATDFATMYRQQNGGHEWLTAPSGTAGNAISFTQAMTLDASGNLGIGVTSPTAKLHIYEPTAAATRIRVLANGGQQAALQLAGNGTTFGTTSFDVFQDGGSDAYVANRANAALQFWTNNTERARIDSSGNLGLGVTPSVWTSYKALQISTGASLASTANQMVLGSNWSFDGSDRYVISDFSTLYIQNSGQHKWYTAPSGTAGNPISFTQAMTLDEVGRLLVGKTANFSGEALQIDANGVGSTVYSVLIGNSSTSTAAYNTMRFIQGASGSATGYLGTGGSTVGNAAFANTFVVGTQTSHALVFNTIDTERARIPAAGGMVIGTTALATTATDGFLYVPTCAGTPTGTPTTQTGTAPIVVDTTNNKLYFYSGGQWRDAGP